MCFLWRCKDETLFCMLMNELYILPPECQEDINRNSKVGCQGGVVVMKKRRRMKSVKTGLEVIEEKEED